MIPLPKMPRTQSGFNQQSKPVAGLALDKKRESVPQDNTKEPVVSIIRDNKK